MSRSVNRVVLIGNVGADPDVRTTTRGTRVAHLSLATNRRYEVDGEEQQRTDWHRLTLWGGAADTAERYVRKGNRLYVEGRIEYGSYERDGVSIPTVDVVVQNFLMLDARSDGLPGRTSAEDAETPGDETMGDESPGEEVLEGIS